MPTLLFDVDGVVIHGYHANPDLRRCWDEDLEKDLGIRRQDFQDHFIRGSFHSEVLIGRLDLHTALENVSPSIGYSGDPNTIINYWMERDAVITPGILPLIERLSSTPGVSLFLATNQEPVRARYLMEVVGLGSLFKDIFKSARLGVLKPDPRFFEAIEQLMGSKEKPVFFDDNQEVVEAARAAGWEAHQFDRPEDLMKSSLVSNLLLNR